MEQFGERMLPAEKRSVFQLYDEGFLVWCGAMVKADDGKYYLYFSFWPKEKGFNAWATHSMIGYAVSDDPLGPFQYGGIALAGAGGHEWDGDCVHNPAVLKVDGKYYLYYMGNRGDGDFWSHRNSQRVGVAWADHPAGPFHRFDRPLIDATPGSFDSLATNNPSVAVGPDGRYYLIYKGFEDNNNPPLGGPLACGMAISDHPLGPFQKVGKPIIVNPENHWSIEDPCIWYEEDRFYALVKDFQGYFNGAEPNSTALFQSFDGIDWAPAEHPLAFHREIHWEDGSVQPLMFMERPQLLLDESGRPAVLLCACCDANDEEKEKTFNIQIGLKRQPERA